MSKRPANDEAFADGLGFQAILRGRTGREGDFRLTRLRMLPGEEAQSLSALAPIAGSPAMLCDA